MACTLLLLCPCGFVAVLLCGDGMEAMQLLWWCGQGAKGIQVDGFGRAGLYCICKRAIPLCPPSLCAHISMYHIVYSLPIFLSEASSSNQEH